MTHPFHPLLGRELALVSWRHNWNEDRVYFQDNQGKLRSVPTHWTDLAGEDPVVVMGAGRSHFRVRDLLELVKLIRGLES